MLTELDSYTEDLRHIVHTLKERYEASTPPDNKDRQMFQIVKEETTPIFDLVDKWESVILEEIHHLPKVFPNQVQNTVDNLQLLIMHSYYIDAPRKRYMELYQSILYVLDQSNIRE